MLWLNGQPATQISALDRGLLYGDSCFTTLRWLHGQLAMVDAHCARLHHDACRLLIAAPPLAELRAELLAFAETVADGVIRFSLTRGEGGGGYGFGSDLRPNRLLHWRPLPALVDARAQTGIRVRQCVTPLAVAPHLAGLKHGNRLEQVMARAEWRDDGTHNCVAEGLMTTAAGHLIEGTFSNVFWRDGEQRWYTPKMDEAGVAGIMRAHLLNQMAERGWQCEERRELLTAVVAEAEEMFVCNSVIGIWPVRRLLVKDLAIGTQTRALQASLSLHSGVLPP